MAKAKANNSAKAPANNKAPTPKRGAPQRSATQRGASPRGTARRSASKRATARASGAIRAASGSVLRRHGRDIFGLAAVAAGLLLAGSVWVGWTGPVGRLLDRALSATVGMVKLPFPVVVIAVGVLALRRRAGAGATATTGVPSETGSAHPAGPTTSPTSPTSPEGADGDSAEAQLEPPVAVDPMARTVIGSLLAMVSIAGLLHVGRGRPGIDAENLGEAGGALGLVVGGVLYAWTALWGSTLILILVGAVGLIVLTQKSVHSFASLLMVVLRPLGRGVRSSARRLIDVLFGDLRHSEPQPLEHSAAHPPVAHPQPQSPPTQVQSPPAQSPPAQPAQAQSSHAQAPPAGATPPAAPTPAAAKPAGSAAGRYASKTRSKWKLPPMNYLAGASARVVDTHGVAERGELLRDTLERFDVPTVPLEPVVGPTVTRFVLELGEGVKVSKLESLRKDIAYAMASPDVRILAPIPGQRAIGVEVPNLDRQIVALGQVLRSPEARQARHPLEVAVGYDINGAAIMMNLAAMPHLLIAGATGAGKSSCINSMLTSILMRSTPDEVRLILVDPKRVEMGQYERVPHLLTAPVTDPRKAANALAWAVREMDRRYDRLHETGFRDIAGYNAAVDAGDVSQPVGRRGPDGKPLRYEHMAYYLVVVDELADLMMVAARDVEESIARLAQMARAVGIHLVLATQRPSVNIITGVIKANIPARLAFAVSSLTDSRVILDQPGAERLVGQGDMLLTGPSSSVPHRIQGCWVTEEEVRKVVAHWVDQAPDFRDDPSVAGDPDGSSGDAKRGPRGGGTQGSLDITADPPDTGDSDDDLVEQATELVVQTQLGSTSMLQRRLRIGFARAGRIMDILEEQGVVGPSTGSKARDVLLSADELEARRRS